MPRGAQRRLAHLSIEVSSTELLRLPPSAIDPSVTEHDPLLGVLVEDALDLFVRLIW